MKIVAPISRVAEVAPLAQAGADEFYCGVVPADWTARFRSASVNRRAFGNLATYEELGAVVATAADFERTVSLVMNAQHYTEAQVDSLVDLACRFAEMGGRALIVGDMGLLSVLAERGPAIRLHASSLLGCRNTEHSLLLKDLGAQRIIFPRDITLPEMAEVASAATELEFEAFILNDGCVFEEGSCHSIHLPSRLGGPICLDRYLSRYARADGRPLAPAEQDRLAANDQAYGEWLWYRFSCGFSVSPEGFPFGPCGLCAIPDLAAAGIRAVKIAGREGALERKVKSVELVRAALDRHAQEGNTQEYLDLVRKLRGGQASCASGYMCYYREAGVGKACAC